MIAASVIYGVMATIIGLVCFNTVSKYMSLKIPAVLYQMENFFVGNLLLLGVLGTYLGFYVALSGTIDKESAAIAISMAVPTSIVAIITYILCGVLITLRERKTYE